MKFRDKDGNVFEDIEEALEAFCAGHYFEGCPISRYTLCNTCLEWIMSHRIVAARLMGYEVVEDGEIEAVEGMCSSSAMDEGFLDWDEVVKVWEQHHQAIRSASLQLGGQPLGVGDPF